MKAALETHLEDLRRRAAAAPRIEDCFAAEPERLTRMTLEASGLRADFSKQKLDLATWQALGRLADDAGLAAARTAMFSGEVINRTEQRPVLHVALRKPELAPNPAEVTDVLAQVERLVEAVHTGLRRGAHEAAFTDVVNIGIGGSHLGPQLACDALRDHATGLHAHFLANVDANEFKRVVEPLNPATTLFVVASKSFTTVETRLNATSARAWLTAKLGSDDAVARHFLAVTSKPERAIDFGLDASCIFPMWDWVGGRYSMWSAIGLPIALAGGMDVFRRLLDGAASMDAHFEAAETGVNLPVMLAMLGIWNTNFLGAESYAMVPYDDRLAYLPDYLQQLEMESNGKRVGLDDALLNHHSAPVTWGGLGTNAQHAFFQLLHQGTRLIPVDFVLALEHGDAYHEHQDMLVANCLAQAAALMRGRRFESSASDGAGVDLARHRESPGDRPSTLLMMDALTPETLGALIALYEHKTFVQSVVWNINAFDQWGVELGKVLAEEILDDFERGKPAAGHDPSTTGLIERYLARARSS